MKQDFTTRPGHFRKDRYDLTDNNCMGSLVLFKTRLLNYFINVFKMLNNIKRSIIAGRILLLKYDSVVFEASEVCISNMNT